MSHFLKLLLNIVVQRIEKKARLSIKKEQFGFMPDRGTRNIILCLRVIAERLLKQQKKLFMCFIDFVKAFDKVRHYEMLGALDGTGVIGLTSFIKVSIDSFLSVEWCSISNSLIFAQETDFS